MSAAWLSAIDRPLGLLPRPELSISRGADARWVARDPVRLTHTELSTEEHALLGWLRLGATLRTLRRQYNERFAPRRIDEAEIDRRLARMHEAGLLISTGHGQGDALWRRRNESRQRNWRWAWTRLLAIRLPGIDPDPLLTRLDRTFGSLFSSMGALALLLLVSAAALLLFSDVRGFVAALPSLASLAEPRYLITLLLTLAGLKTLHELGHGMACKRFGGEVREMGVLLLAFTPCLYCDVSDAWQIQSRRKRLLINGAGMVVELAVACGAIIVWRFSEPGLVRLLAVNTALLATLGTLLVNLNPLLRYDGYYLLSDTVGVPNLWTRSRTACAERAKALFMRNEKRTRVLSEPLWMALYGAASQAYLVLVIGGVAWLMLSTLKVLRLEAIGWLLAGVIGASFLAPPVASLLRHARRPQHNSRVRWGRVVVATLLVGSTVWIGWGTPWRHRIAARALVAPSESAAVAITLPGRLLTSVAPGSLVEAGQVLATLHNAEVDHRLLLAEEELRRLQLEQELLDAQRALDPQANSQLPAAKEAIEQSRRRLAELKADAARLTLRAPRAGIVLAARRHAEQQAEGLLSDWEGDPLEQNNLGAWLERGDLLCLVATPGQAELELLVDGADADRIALGQPVRIALDQTPGVVLTGTVSDFSRQAHVAPKTNAPITQRDHPSCRVRVEISPDIESQLGRALVIQGVGTARIETDAATLGEQIASAWRRTFRLP